MAASPTRTMSEWQWKHDNEYGPTDDHAHGLMEDLWAAAALVLCTYLN